MAKLTAKETKWLAELQAKLNECPSERMGFYTIGDNDVVVYDRRKDKELNAMLDRGGLDFCVAVSRLDVALGEIIFPSAVHSTAG